MPKIIISYRRADSDAITGRIRDRLAAHYGAHSVFMDIDSIPFGTDYRSHIKESLLQHDVMLVIIGTRWLGNTKGGRARIKDEADPVRIEVEIALLGGIPIVPVLVLPANMPKPSELPDGIKDLSYRNAAALDGGRDFHPHMDRLIRSIDRIVAGGPATETELRDPASTITPAAPHSPASAMPFGPTTQASPAEPIKNAPRRRIAVALAAVGALGIAGVLAWIVVASNAVKQSERTGIVFSDLGAKTSDPARPQNQDTMEPANGQPTQQALATDPPQLAQAHLVACTRTSSTFEEDFQSARSGWDTSRLGSGNKAQYTEGHLILQAAEKASMGILYTLATFRDVNVCVRLMSPRDENTRASTGAGLIFWARDQFNYYIASLHPDGSYSIYRHAAGATTAIASPTRHESVKPGLRVVNELTLSLNNNNATLFVNKAKVRDFRGDPPSDGSKIGLWVHSQDDQPNEWRILDVVVTGAARPVSAR